MAVVTHEMGFAREVCRSGHLYGWRSYLGGGASYHYHIGETSGPLSDRNTHPAAGPGCMG